MYKIQPIRVAYIKPINLIFCAPFNTLYTETGGTFWFFKTCFWFFSTIYSRKNGLGRKLKLDTQIK